MVRGASFWTVLRAAVPPTPPTPSCSPRCGISCGRRGHQRLAGSRCARMLSSKGLGSKGGRAKPGPVAPAARVGSPASARRWAPAAGAWSRRCCSPRRRPREAAHTQRVAVARALRRGHPRGRAGRGRARWLRQRVRRVEGAGRTRPHPARLLRGRPRGGAVQPAGRGRSAASRPATCPTASSTQHDAAAPVVLAATDPAQPYGAAVAWPPTPGAPLARRRASVVLRDGVPLVWFDRRSHHVVTFPPAETDRGGPRRWPHW